MCLDGKTRKTSPFYFSMSLRIRYLHVNGSAFVLIQAIIIISGVWFVLWPVDQTVQPPQPDPTHGKEHSRL